jgi:hypothetical protein
MKSQSRSMITDILGWYGISAVLLAYALTSFEVILPHSPFYHVLNLTGALGIIIEAHSKHDYPAVTLNVIWALIAIGSVIFIFYTQ